MSSTQSIKSSREAAHEENMWGKPANDIVVGIGNIRTVPASRGIWELVQNARDVVKSGERAEIVFKRTDKEFFFQHDGVPFTWSTLEALILQTSSKPSNNVAQVGQYGTGFLTTHKFGLVIKLTAPLQLDDTGKKFYNFKDFEINRSATTKEDMREAIKEQYDKTEEWTNDIEHQTSIPDKSTVFRYQTEHDVERRNVKEAFEKSPDLVPYVLLTNDGIKSIKFEDDIDNKNQCFIRESNEWKKIEEFHSGDLFSTEINNTEYFVIKSKERSSKNADQERVMVILPIRKDSKGNLIAEQLERSIPQLFLFLPLLGTSDWGLDFIINSPDFTCDTDSRDSLRLVGNGQNNDDQAEENKKIVALAQTLVFEYIDAHIQDIAENRFLVRDNFIIKQAEPELESYYKDLRSSFRKKFNGLGIVKQPQGQQPIEPNIIKVLDEDLCKACHEQAKLLDAIYSLLDKHAEIKKPLKIEMLYWSNTINEWYKDEENPNSLTIDDVAELISKTKIDAQDVNWLYTLCTYIHEIKRDDLFDAKSILPNESYDLKTKSPLLKPYSIPQVVKDALTEMVPDVVENFIHTDFANLFADLNKYEEANASKDITDFINNHNTPLFTKRNELKKDKLIGYKAESSYTADGNYLAVIYKPSTVEVIIGLYSSLLKDDSESVYARVFPLLLKFYSLDRPVTQTLLGKDFLDIRKCCFTLVNDSLYSFSLAADKSSKSDWCLNLVETIFGHDQMDEILNSYQVYPDRTGDYKYAEQLSKKPSYLPERVTEIYDSVVNASDPAKSIKHQLVASQYEDFFVGQKILSSEKICADIEEKVKLRGYSITNFPQQNDIVEIVENISSQGTTGELWAKLFNDIDQHKGEIMFSIIQSQSKKESIFQIMKVEDESKLKMIANLSKREDLAELIELGDKALQDRQNKEEDEKYKKALGDYVEQYLLKQLDGELKNKVHVNTEDIQGGQDIIIYKDERPIYYIEVKSRWLNEQSVLMSTLQYQRSIENPDRYALTAVNMYNFDRSYVDEHKYPPFEDIKPRIRVLENIGRYNDGLVKKVDNEAVDPHVNNGFQILVPQDLINDPEKSVDFDTFMIDLVEKIKM